MYLKYKPIHPHDNHSTLSSTICNNALCIPDRWDSFCRNQTPQRWEAHKISELSRDSGTVVFYSVIYTYVLVTFNNNFTDLQNRNKCFVVITSQKVLQYLLHSIYVFMWCVSLYIHYFRSCITNNVQAWQSISTDHLLTILLLHLYSRKFNSYNKNTEKITGMWEKCKKTTNKIQLRDIWSTDVQRMGRPIFLIN